MRAALSSVSRNPDRDSVDPNVGIDYEASPHGYSSESLDPSQSPLIKTRSSELAPLPTGRGSLTPIRWLCIRSGLIALSTEHRANGHFPPAPDRHAPFFIPFESFPFDCVNIRTARKARAVLYPFTPETVSRSSDCNSYALL